APRDDAVLAGARVLVDLAFSGRDALFEGSRLVPGEQVAHPRSLRHATAATRSELTRDTMARLGADGKTDAQRGAPACTPRPSSSSTSARSTRSSSRVASASTASTPRS